MTGRHVAAIAFRKSEWRAPEAARWAKAAGWKTTTSAHTSQYWRWEQAAAKRGYKYAAEVFPAEDDGRDVIYVQAPSRRSNPSGRSASVFLPGQIVRYTTAFLRSTGMTASNRINGEVISLQPMWGREVFPLVLWNDSPDNDARPVNPVNIELDPRVRDQEQRAARGPIHVGADQAYLERIAREKAETAAWRASPEGQAQAGELARRASSRQNPVGDREREVLRQTRLSLMGEQGAAAAERLEEAYEKVERWFSFDVSDDANDFADAVRQLQGEWGEQGSLFGGGDPNVEIVSRSRYELLIRAPRDAMKRVEAAARKAGGRASKAKVAGGGGQSLDLFHNPSGMRPNPLISPGRKFYADQDGSQYWVDPVGEESRGWWQAYRWNALTDTPEPYQAGSTRRFPAPSRREAEAYLLREVPALRRSNPAFTAVDASGAHLGSVQAASDADARSKLRVDVASHAGPSALDRWQRGGYKIVPAWSAGGEPGTFQDNEILQAIRDRAQRARVSRAGARVKNFKEDLAPQFIILVGPPASGKSWFVENALKDKTPFGFRGKFPRLMAGGTSVRESDALLREQQHAAAREDFARLQAALDHPTAFSDVVADLWYHLGGERRGLEQFSGQIGAAVRSGFPAFRKLTSGYYASMRGRHEGESLKDAARAAFEERTTNRLVRSGDTVIVDSAGEDILRTPWEAFLGAAKAAGFTTSLVWLNAPLSLSIARQVHRHVVKGGRMVPEDQTRAAFNAMVNAVRRITSDPNLDRFVEYRWDPKAPFTEADWIRDPAGPPGAKKPGQFYAFAGGWRLAQDQRLHLQRRLRRPASVSLASA